MKFSFKNVAGTCLICLFICLVQQCLHINPNLQLLLGFICFFHNIIYHVFYSKYLIFFVVCSPLRSSFFFFLEVAQNNWHFLKLDLSGGTYQLPISVHQDKRANIKQTPVCLLNGPEWVMFSLYKSRSEQAPGSVFHPRDKSEIIDCDFLGPSWCNIKIDSET